MITWCCLASRPTQVKIRDRMNTGLKQRFSWRRERRAYRVKIRDRMNTGLKHIGQGQPRPRFSDGENQRPDEYGIETLHHNLGYSLTCSVKIRDRMNTGLKHPNAGPVPPSGIGVKIRDRMNTGLKQISTDCTYSIIVCENQRPDEYGIETVYDLRSPRK